MGGRARRAAEGATSQEQLTWIRGCFYLQSESSICFG